MDSAGKIGQPSSPVNKLRNDHSGGVDVEIGSSEVEEDLSQEEDGIPLSDIESMSEAEREDIVPHQRLTINNTTALLRSYKSISAPQTLPFSAHQTLFSPSHTEIPDVHDDLNRELAFYKQALDATLEARQLLTKEKSPFTRPGDYFAEMVKSDEHMDKIRAKMVEEAANKKAAAEARKQRDLKKFGKQVQIARLQERDRAKRETLDNINQLKRSKNLHWGVFEKLTLYVERKGTNLGQTAEEDLFDVALENEGISKSRRRGQSGTATPRSSTNRQKKDEKFGYGGKKRFSKSGDALSAGDLSSFSAKRMKGQRASARRPGKSRRAKFS